MLKKLWHLLGAIAMFAVSTSAIIPEYSSSATNAEPTPVTITFEAGVDYASTGNELTKEYITLTASDGTWGKETSWTIATKNPLAISIDTNRGYLTKVEITADDPSKFVLSSSSSEGTYDGTTGVWTALDSQQPISISLLNDSTESSVNITKIEVTKIKKFEVLFDLNGHGKPTSQPDPQYIVEGGKVTKPKTPTDLVDRFTGWYKEPECINAWNFETDLIYKDTTIYAQWEDWHLLIYWSDYGYEPTCMRADSVLNGECATPFPAPDAPDGYMFDGWYYYEEGMKEEEYWTIPVDFSIPITAPFYLQAKWVCVPYGNATGGFYKNDQDKKQQVVGFGFTYKDYAKLSDTDQCGIYIYSNESGTGTPIASYIGTDISTLKSNQGRFYCTFDCPSDYASYYAKAFVTKSGESAYSDILEASGNYDVEYTI